MIRIDPAGLSFDELWWTNAKYDISIAWKANELSNQAIEAAQEYAKATGLTYNEPNKSDAWRHFLWNAKMVREIGFEESEFVGNNHEFKSMIDLDQSYVEPTNYGAPSIVTGRLNQQTIMDLWNNQVGRVLADRRDLKNKNYNELWIYANKHNMIIESAEHVYEFLGLDDSYIIAEDWSVNMVWDTETGNIAFINRDASKSVILKIGV